MDLLRRRSSGSGGEPTSQVHRSGGVASGFIGLGMLVVVVVVSIRGDGFGPWVYPGALGAALLVWAVMIRPAVEVRPDEVVLHNPISVVTLPYARIRSVQVKQFTRFEVDPPDGGDDAVRVDCAGLGRSRGRIRRDAREPAQQGRISVQAMVEDRISRRARDARRLADDPRPLTVERTWWLIVAAPALLLVAVVISLL